jgi:PAS domain S-box-containing protein
MLWLYLLAAVTLLVISRRRLRLRIIPLDDAVYSSKVAVEHVHSGVAWVSVDGKVSSPNQSLVNSMGTTPADLVGRDWYSMFAPEERGKVKKAYAQMLLAGIASIETTIVRSGGSNRAVDLRLVAGHDHKMRLVGHHCMLHDRAQQRDLESQVLRLSEALEQASQPMTQANSHSSYQ